MFRRKAHLVLLCLTAFCACMQAQQDSGSVPPPVTLLNQSTLAFTSELERSNYLSGGISLGATFDDNALNTTPDRVGNFAYSFLPFIELDQARSRLSWKLNYAGGFVLNQHLAQRNQGSHNFGTHAQYRLSPHVTLTVRDHFFNTTGFYDQVNHKLNPPAEELLQRPNAFVITPLSQQVGNTAAVQIDYQFARDSMIGVSGSLYLLHYHDVPVGTSLVDTQSLGANAYYSHRLFGQNWVGINYRYQKLSFSPLPSKTFVLSILVTDTVKVWRGVTLALFAGPQQLNDTTGLLPGTHFLVNNPIAGPFRSRFWSVVAGGSFNWNGKRTAFVAGASRMVNDGGGVTGAVRLISADGAVRHQWTQSFSSQLGIMYGNNHALSTFTSPYSSLKMVSANFSVTRTLRNSVFLTFGYARDLQQQYLALPNAANIKHNRAWAMISYNFNRPLGR